MSDNEMTEEQRLLAELEQDETEQQKRSRLFQRAEELGLQVGKKTKTENLEARIEEAEAKPNNDGKDPAPATETEGRQEADEKRIQTYIQSLERGGTKFPTPSPEPQPAGFTVRNDGKNVRRIGGVGVAPGQEYRLSDMQAGDKRLMAKVNRMLELGVLSRVTD